MGKYSPPDRHAPPHRRVPSTGNDYYAQQATQQLSARTNASRLQTSRSLMPQESSDPNARPSISNTFLAPRIAGGTSRYSQGHRPTQSSERLLPPQENTRTYRDDDGMRSQTPSRSNSRQTSWSGSERSYTSHLDGASPFDGSRPSSRAGSDYEEKGVNTQTVSEKYNITPSAGLLLFPEDIEKDDYLHTPDKNDRNKILWSDIFSARGFVNMGGLLFLIIGILGLFIVYPVLTYVQRFMDPNNESCSQNPLCLQDDATLLKRMRTGLIDPDTPDSAMSRTSSTGGSQSLVFSDEFNVDGRSFYAGDDPYWQGVDVWYGATFDLEWYDPDALSTQDGYLAIRFDTFRSHGLNFRSGMLQSWNKLCFKSGYLEASISLPGKGDTSGFWPGFWTMGNLGRPGYLSTTDGMWPYSYHDGCDAGITANQSDPDGLSALPGMRLPACTCQGSNHPSPGISRSAPEIDALEATVGYLEPPAFDAIGQVSQSFQTAPFDIFYRPNTEFIEIYDRAVTQANPYQGGVTQEALSALTNLNNDWYNGNAYQSYGFEYSPGADGYITWYIGEQQTWTLKGQAIGPNGNIGQRVIPEEPMHVIVNLGMSDGFAPINYTHLPFPSTMRVDYIRIYQDDGGEMTCDPEGYPTTPYIAEHPRAYQNPNATTWAKAGYEWPQNTYVEECTAASSYKEKRFYEEKRATRNKRHEDVLKKRSWMPWS